MSSLTVSRRKLWAMKCESLFQIMASSVSPEVLDTFCRTYQLAGPRQTPAKADWYQWAHEQCHKDSPFTRHMQHYLNRKHTVVVARLRVRSPESIQQTVETLLARADTNLPQDIAGIIWAIASDLRPEIRPLEEALVNGLHVLSHYLLVAHLRGERSLVASEPVAVSPDTALQREVAMLSTERQTLRTSLTQQRQEKERLQEQLRVLTCSYNALQYRLQTVQSAPADHGAMPREIKKLRHRVDKLMTLVDDKERTIRHLHCLLQSSTACLHAAEGVSPKQEQPAAPVRRQSPCLQGKKVALVGGMGRAVPHYLETIQALGGCCLHHDGNLSQGEKKLAEIVKQADFVFCMVNRNSHSATTSTKKLCKALDKPCYFLSSSGISQVRDKLLELAI